MARDYFLNGETMVYVKGNTYSGFPSLTELGLADQPIRIHLNFRHDDIKVDAYGPHIPPEVQFMLADVNVSMSLVHFDRTVLDNVWRQSMAGAPAVGQLPRAGTRMGNGFARFGTAGGGSDNGALGNHYVGLNLASPMGNKPWRFYYAYLLNQQEFPLGVERSLVQLEWRCIAYAVDPAGETNQTPPILGAQGNIIWDYVLDN